MLYDMIHDMWFNMMLLSMGAVKCELDWVVTDPNRPIEEWILNHNLQIHILLLSCPHV